jgi:DNA-binding MarR family transcriptional regulator
MHYSPGHYISAVHRHLQIYLNSRFDALGFGSGQYLFYNRIAHSKGITQKELSSKMAIDKATTAKAVKKLVELGYVKSVTDKADKRFQNLFLSDKGREILPEVQSILMDTRGILHKGFNESEIELSLEFMDRMLINITEEVKPQRN